MERRLPLKFLHIRSLSEIFHLGVDSTIPRGGPPMHGGCRDTGLGLSQHRRRASPGSQQAEPRTEHNP